MMRVTIEVVPGGCESLKRTIATIQLANISDLDEVSDYEMVADLDSKSSPRKVAATIRGHLRSHGWMPLVQRAIEKLWHSTSEIEGAGTCRLRTEGGGRGARPMSHPVCVLEQRGNDWIAIPRGKSSPVLRPVPGNAYPATAATWRSREAAALELASWGWAVMGACPDCKCPKDAVNHVPGHIFVGRGHGWQPCPHCEGSGVTGISLQQAATEQRTRTAKSDTEGNGC